MARLSPLEILRKKQRENFGLDQGKCLSSKKEAEKFLKHVGMALRYWPADNMPVASLYQAAWGKEDPPPSKTHDEPGGVSPREEAQRRAIVMTNHLMDTQQGIEVNVIAKRLVLVHRDLVPSLYRLVRNQQLTTNWTGITAQAKRVFQLIELNKGTTVGHVRKFLGITSAENGEMAYQALSELQSKMWIDRGPFVMREKGIPYLSKEGYPYHCFHLAHRDLITASSKLTRERASTIFLSGFLRGALFVTDKKLLTLFGSFLTRSDLDVAVEYLVDHGIVTSEQQGRDRIITYIQ